MKFKKSIELLQKFSIETVILGWDEKAFLLRQRFIRNEMIFTEATVRARFLKKSGGSVFPSDIITLIGLNIDSPLLDPQISDWNKMQIGK